MTDSASDFQLVEKSDSCFAISGTLGFATVADILRSSEELFENHTRIEVDLSAVDESDSAGLALLLEWITWANHTVREIRFTSVPDKLHAIAQTSGVEDLLKAGERWSGFFGGADEEEEQ